MRTVVPVNSRPMGDVGFWRRFLLASALCLTVVTAALLAANLTSVGMCIRSRECSLPSNSLYNQTMLVKMLSPSWEGLHEVADQAREHADIDGMAVWTLANFSWLDFVLNWVGSARKVGITNFFVACLDDMLLAELQRRGIPSLRLPSSLGAEELQWGSDIFKERGRQKIKFIRAMLRAGLAPMFADLDVVWLSNPLPYLKNFPAADILISLDLLNPNKFDGSLESCPEVLSWTLLGMQNVGIHLMRPGALPVVQAWVSNMQRSTEMEQVVYNRVVQEGITNAGLPSGPPTPYCRTLGGKVTIGLLSSANFVNGHLYYTQGLPEWEEANRVTMYAVHTTFVSAKLAKRHYMRERKLWQADPPERFNPQRGFLSFDINVPHNLISAAGPPEPPRVLLVKDVEGHVDLMRFQLARLGIAMQLSQALGRELILPPLWCGLDNGWEAHTGRVAGTRAYPLPYICPLAKIANIERWSAEVLRGRLPNFHEPAILDHTLMAQKTRLVIDAWPQEPPPEQPAATELDPGLLNTRGQPPQPPEVVPCTTTLAKAASEDCRIMLPRWQSIQQLQLALKEFSHVDILHFADIKAIWGEKRYKTSAEFRNATTGLLEPWCCAEGDIRIPFSF